MRLRIKFRKYGAVRFIGHLDVMRFFQKAIRRAQIDVAYTAGFSPHQIMAFAAPLGVGLVSNGEYMDIEVHSIASCQDVMERLNQVSVAGIETTCVKILPKEAGNAMASVAAASYTVCFKKDKIPQIDMTKALSCFLSREEIKIIKKTKKGTRELDLRKGIYSLECSPDGKFNMLLDASSGGNIKPVQVMEALLAENGVILPENALLITREDLYTETTTQTGERKWISLNDVGYDDYSELGESPDMENDTPLISARNTETENVNRSKAGRSASEGAP